MHDTDTATEATDEGGAEGAVDGRGAEGGAEATDGPDTEGATEATDEGGAEGGAEGAVDGEGVGELMDGVDATEPDAPGAADTTERPDAVRVTEGVKAEGVGG